MIMMINGLESWSTLSISAGDVRYANAIEAFNYDIIYIHPLAASKVKIVPLEAKAKSTKKTTDEIGQKIGNGKRYKYKKKYPCL